MTFLTFTIALRSGGKPPPVGRPALRRSTPRRAQARWSSDAAVRRLGTCLSSSPFVVDCQRLRPCNEPPDLGGGGILWDRERLMHLRKTGEQSRVDGYLEAQGLGRNDLFKQVVQAVLNWPS